MPRPPKNPDHPLTRLRRLLSDRSGQNVTREVFADRVGIPAWSIRAIEVGMYQMTDQVAARIAEHFGLNKESWLRGDDPLLDVDGRVYDPLGPRSDWKADDRREGALTRFLHHVMAKSEGRTWGGRE